MNYQEAWDFLDGLQFFKIKLGLESMTRFMARLGGPQENLDIIHIAGTNGKGSVAATLLAILSQAGYKTGVYTSPHLTSVRERFRINDHYIGEHDFARHASRIRDVLAGEQITYFEFTTALAFLWFAAEQVDYVILETGMGGRLDATNIITPRVSIITNVAMDHEAYLGTTLADIAREKAGIIKPGVPVVSGVTEPDIAELLWRVAEEVEAPFYTLGQDFFLRDDGEQGLTYQGVACRSRGHRLSLRGAHQADNAALALAGIEVMGDGAGRINDAVLHAALPAVRWPGRLEFFPDLPWAGRRCAVLLDGAHNPAGVQALIAALRSDFPHERLIMVWASMGDKDFAACVALVAPLCHRLIFTRPEELRSATPEALTLALPAGQRAKALSAPSVPAALGLAYELAGPGDLICVAGSLYLIGKARAALVGELVGD